MSIVSELGRRSRRAIVEFLVVLGWCLWAALISWSWPLGFGDEIDLLDRLDALFATAAAFIGVIAFINDERIGDSRYLNRWDETVALYGSECLVDIAASL